MNATLCASSCTMYAGASPRRMRANTLLSSYATVVLPWYCRYELSSSMDAFEQPKVAARCCAHAKPLVCCAVLVEDARRTLCARLDLPVGLRLPAHAAAACRA